MHSGTSCLLSHEQLCMRTSVEKKGLETAKVFACAVHSNGTPLIPPNFPLHLFQLPLHSLHLPSPPIPLLRPSPLHPLPTPFYPPLPPPTLFHPRFISWVPHCVLCIARVDDTGSMHWLCAFMRLCSSASVPSSPRPLFLPSSLLSSSAGCPTVASVLQEKKTQGP